MEQLSNAAVTTLASGITNSATTLSLTSATNFPTSGNFRIIVENEIMKVTGVSGTTLTVARGQEGTTAVSHTSGVAIAAVLTKAGLETVLGEQFQSGLFSARPATPREGTVWADTDSQYQYVYTSAGWALKHPVYIPASAGIDLSGWTGINLTSSSWTTRNGVLHALSTDNSASPLKIYHKALPSAPYKLNIAARLSTWQITYFNAGFGFYDTVSGKVYVMQIGTVSGAAYTVLSVQNYSSPSSLNATPYVSNMMIPDVVYLQIEDDNTNWYFRLSLDGINYITLYSTARNTYITPNRVCFSLGHNSGYGVDRFIDIFGYWEN